MCSPKTHRTGSWCTRVTYGAKTKFKTKKNTKTVEPLRFLDSTRRIMARCPRTVALGGYRSPDRGLGRGDPGKSRSHSRRGHGFPPAVERASRTRNGCYGHHGRRVSVYSRADEGALNYLSNKPDRIVRHACTAYEFYYILHNVNCIY